MMSGERDQIKIKINGKDKHYKDNDKSNNVEIAAGIASSNKEDEFEWVLPEHSSKSQLYYDAEREMDEVYYSPRVQSPYYNNKTRKLGKRKHPNSKQLKLMIPKAVILSIISAIIIGVGLGFAVLFVFTDEKGNEVPASSNVPVQNDEKKQTNLPAETANFELDFHIVQGGVYSSTENANTAITTLKEQNVPAVVEERDGKFYILIGVAGSEEVTEQLESEYKAEGLEAPYAKPWSYKIENVSLPTSVEKSWILKGEELLKQLITASGEAVSGSFDKSNVQTLQADFQEWNEKKPSKLEKSKNISDRLDFYAESLKDGIKFLSGDNPMDTQQKVLNAYVAFHSVVSELAK